MIDVPPSALSDEDENSEDNQDPSGEDGDSHDSNELSDTSETPSIAPSKQTDKPSRGAARKALADGDDSKIAQLVATDRAKAARRSEKHHGRKAHAGKGGRAHAGGKAKTGKSRVINDSLDF